MGTKNPGKLDIKALESQFDASLNHKPYQPPVLPYKNRKPIPKQERPLYWGSNSRNTIKPPRVPVEKPKPPPTAAKPKPGAVVTAKQAEFKNELAAKLSNMPMPRPEDEADAPQELTPPATYKGHPLPSSVVIDNVCYELIPLTGNVEGVLPRPYRPSEVEVVIPDDAEDDVYDNNVSIMSKMQICTPDYSDDEYDENKVEAHEIYEACDDQLHNPQGPIPYQDSDEENYDQIDHSNNAGSKIQQEVYEVLT